MAVYLDHNASAPLLPEARHAIGQTLDLTGNPSSVHGHGRALSSIIEKARDQVAKATGARRSQVVFTSSATESITQAIVGGVRALKIDEIITCAGEHSAVLNAAKSTGKPVIIIGLTEDGQVKLDELKAAITAADSKDHLALVAIQAVNNETGVIQPLTKVEILVGPTQHFLFVDAVQALGKQALNFDTDIADMMALSAHKIGGPAGVGALLVKSACDEVRLISGGGQEQGRRGGTPSTALIAGFGAAADRFPKAYSEAETNSLHQALEAGIKDICKRAVIFGVSADRVGNVTNFAIPDISASVILMGLDLDGISVSSGSACSSGRVAQSHVLKAMGIAADLDGAIRVSLGWSSTMEDVTAFLTSLAKVLGKQAKANGQAA
jgi:cysteine desulfurase